MGGGWWRWGGDAALISASAKLIDLGAAGVVVVCKLQALVYDILPSTTAVFSYAIGSLLVLKQWYDFYKQLK